MNIQKLGKQLRREATASPKKAMVLGMLVLVAGWFWAPLVWGWVAGDDTSAGGTVASSASVAPAAPSAPAAASPTVTLPTVPTPAGPAEPKQPKHPWQQLVKWMEGDPRTLAATVVSEQRDPFHSPKTEVVQPEPQQTPQQPAEEQLVGDLTPAELGFTLSSTIVGTSRRTARINGKAYDEGKTIEAEKDGVKLRFRLIEVHPRRVVLTRNGKRFDLKIPRRASSEGTRMLGKAD